MITNLSKLLKSKLVVTALLSLFGISMAMAQSSRAPYVKFTEDPVMILNKKKTQFTNYKIEFKTKKTSTIYLELVDPTNVVVANSVLELKGRKKGQKNMTMRVFKDVRLKSSSNYKYRLIMFEAPINTWTGKLTPTVIEKVRVTSKR